MVDAQVLIIARHSITSGDLCVPIILSARYYFDIGFVGIQFAGAVGFSVFPGAPRLVVLLVATEPSPIGLAPEPFGMSNAGTKDGQFASQIQSPQF